MKANYLMLASATEMLTKVSDGRIWVYYMIIWPYVDIIDEIQLPDASLGDRDAHQGPIMHVRCTSYACQICVRRTSDACQVYAVGDGHILHVRIHSMPCYHRVPYMSATTI